MGGSQRKFILVFGRPLLQDEDIRMRKETKHKGHASDIETVVIGVSSHFGETSVETSDPAGTGRTGRRDVMRDTCGHSCRPQ